MKYTLCILVAIMLVVTTPSVHAVDSLTDAQLNAIVANCSNAQVSIQRVQQSDKPTRINRGYLYDTILKLMVNLNTRAAQNRIDAPDLLTVTNKYEQEVKQFTQVYTDYDDAVTSIAKISCQETPTDFYDQLVSIRAKRSALNKSVVTIDGYIDAYGQGVQRIHGGALSINGESN